MSEEKENEKQKKMKPHSMPTFVDLHRALHARNIGLVEQLVRSGIDVNAALRGQTPLCLAINTGAEATVELLLLHGAKVNKMSRDHLERFEPPLYTACRLGSARMATILLKFHADVNQSDWYGQTPLWVSVRERRLDLVELLLANGARLSDVRCWSECPLFLATKYLQFGRRDIAVLLTRSGCDPNLMDTNWRSSLFWALKYGDKELVFLLVMAGARVNDKWDWNQVAPSLEEDINFCAWLMREKKCPPALKQLCRLSIRRRIVSVNAGAVYSSIQHLPLPTAMKAYLNLDPP